MIKCQKHMINEKGYIFKNYFDTICYLVISIIYPFLTWGVQNKQPCDEIGAKLNLIITGLFFLATFFYDYYQRYRDCNEQTEVVVNVLFWGRFIFCFLTILSFVFLIIVACDFFPEITEELMRLWRIMPALALYPFVIAAFEIGKRLYLERKGKISSVSV